MLVRLGKNLNELIILGFRLLVLPGHQIDMLQNFYVYFLYVW